MWYKAIVEVWADSWYVFLRWVKSYGFIFQLFLLVAICDLVDCSSRPAPLPRLLYPWGSPGKKTGVGNHAFSRGSPQTQESNLCLLCLLHWQADSLSECHLGSPFSLAISGINCSEISLRLPSWTSWTFLSLLSLPFSSSLQQIARGLWKGKRKKGIIWGYP